MGKKNNKMPLSKKIGEWDNGASDNQQKVNTMGEIEKAFNCNSEFQKMLGNKEMQINLRGSSTKNNDIDGTSDVDIQVVFPASSDLSELKSDCLEVLENKFGKDSVHRLNTAIRIDKNDNRRSVDLMVCKQGEECIIALHDLNGEVEYYPTLDQRNIGQKNVDANSTYSKMVRTYKSLRNEMKDNIDIKPITSYTIECLLFIIRPRTFKKKYSNDTEQDSLRRFCAILQAVSARLCNFESAKKFKEINGKKDLFVDEEYFEIVKRYWQDMRNYIKDNYNMGA